jgi:hypothetical protein
MLKTKPREIRSYDYVNHPYERVAGMLCGRTHSLCFRLRQVPQYRGRNRLPRNCTLTLVASESRPMPKFRRASRFIASTLRFSS